MTDTTDALTAIKAELQAAMATKKCHRCGCFQGSIKTLQASAVLNRSLGPLLFKAEQLFERVRYDCLGCEVCWPATAQNLAAGIEPDLSDGHLCPVEIPGVREGWPPFPGDYQVQTYRASVAVCTLNADTLLRDLSADNIQGVSIIGTLRTENLGIEHIIRNILANPNIRFLFVCGEDTKKAIGHLPGQSLVSLFQQGVDEQNRIIGAHGKRPILKNITKEQIGGFLQQVSVVEKIGMTGVDEIKRLILRLTAKCVPPFTHAITDITPIIVEQVGAPERLTLDPAGYFVVYPDRERQQLLLEHYTSKGVLTRILGAKTPAALVLKVIEDALVSRLDHAAYLGCELARAEMALLSGKKYVQDRAPGEFRGRFT